MRLVLLLFFLAVSSLYAAAQPTGLAAPRNAATAYYRQQLSEQVQAQLNKIDWSRTERRTSGSGVLYTIPVVFHVLHNYGDELLADDDIYYLMSVINGRFLMTTADTANIIDKFKPVAASTQIAFKLATVDPNGNQTKGIEHIFTYLTYAQNAFPLQSEIGQWPPDKYLNVWLCYDLPSFNYAYTPYEAAYAPYYDGIIIYWNSYTYATGVAGFFGNYLNLPNPCGCCSSGCVDNDGIPDTPPCDNTFFTCANIYGTTCDTPNGQNVMSNVDSCAIMFTYGQGAYMQYVLQLDFGHRDSLVTTANFLRTGMNNPMPDMLPVPDFCATPSISARASLTSFYCIGQNVVFYNKSWNDTITAVSWAFSNNAALPVSTSSTNLINKFATSGWVTVSLSATGNNSGTATITNPQALYVADTTPTVADGYYQDFGPGGDIDKWPMFNYYNNGFKWQTANVGFYDNTSVQYTGYDYRTFPQNMTGTPSGDFDDIFTPVFDLSDFYGNCYLNFESSGASLTNETHFMDSLEIDYSIDLAQTWQKFGSLSGTSLANKGIVDVPYAPSGMGDWVPQAFPVPTAARKRQTIFRLRYHPKADSNGISMGNNFYIDRFNINSMPEGVNTVTPGASGVALYPNPARNGTWVVIRSLADIGQATIRVADVTGREVYKTIQVFAESTARLEIPENVLPGKGIYMIQVVTGSINSTQKLIVY